MKQEGLVTEQTITVAVNSFELSATEGNHVVCESKEFQIGSL